MYNAMFSLKPHQSAMDMIALNLETLLSEQYHVRDVDFGVIGQTSYLLADVAWVLLVSIF